MSKSPTVAIVDDDLGMREALDGILKSCGYLTKSFVSAEDFLENRAASEIDCIVLDVRMPGISGMELLNLLNSGGPHPPVIFITSYHDEHTKKAASLAGAHDFLTKPVDDDVLLASLRSALDMAAP